MNKFLTCLAAALALIFVSFAPCTASAAPGLRGVDLKTDAVQEVGYWGRRGYRGWRYGPRWGYRGYGYRGWGWRGYGWRGPRVYVGPRYYGRRYRWGY